jgi:hypothetical protein
MLSASSGGGCAECQQLWEYFEERNREFLKLVKNSYAADRTEPQCEAALKEVGKNRQLAKRKILSHARECAQTAPGYSDDFAASIAAT